MALRTNDSFDLAPRSGVGSTHVISVDAQRSAHMLTKEKLEMHKALILADTSLLKTVPAPDREAMAMAGAILQVFHDISLSTEEAYIANMDGKYKVIVGYKGLVKSLGKKEKETGLRWMDGATTYMTPDEIKHYGFDICQKCGGNGGGQYECKKCKGKGSFNPTDVLHCTLELVCIQDKRAAKELGIDYYPTTGTAIWQPGDNVAKTKTPQWQVQKNARKDAIRKIASIVGEHRSQDPVTPEEDVSTENIAMLASQFGLNHDDIHSLADFVRNCIYTGKWDNEEEVIRDLVSLDVVWESGMINEIKYRLFGHKNGEYPLIDTGALDSDVDPNGILVMNVILDVGGKEQAHKISEKLFGKPCSIDLTRAQLKQILEEGDKIIDV